MPFDGFFQNFGIHLSCSDVAMSHHAGNILYWYIIGESQGCKAVTGNMHRQRLVYIASYLYEV